MDVNLTAPVAASIYIIQPWYIPAINFSMGLIGALIGLFGGFILEGLKERKDLEFKKIDVYSQIRGLKEKIAYYYGESLFKHIEAERYFLYSDIEKDNMAKTYYAQTHINLKKEEEDLEKELIDNLRLLGEKLGTLNILISNDDKLDRLMLSVDSIGYVNTSIKNDITKLTRGNKNVKSTNDANNLVDDIYEKFYADARIKTAVPIDDLLDHLENRIKNGHPWWLFWRRDNDYL